MPSLCKRWKHCGLSYKIVYEDVVRVRGGKDQINAIVDNVTYYSGSEVLKLFITRTLLNITTFAPWM